MVCPKCGQDSPGNFCSNCGAFMYLKQELPETDVQEEMIQTPLSYSQTDREQRGASRKKVKAKKTFSRGGAASDKHIKKEIHEKDRRIKKLENEMQKVSGGQQRRSRKRQSERQQDGGAGLEISDAALKTAVGMTVLCSRLLQLASFLLMFYIVWRMQRFFIAGGNKLGNILTMFEERNYTLAAFTGVASIFLFFTIIWCFWILSKKDAGGSVRLKKYDTGRGFIPFLLCAVIFTLTQFVTALFPAPEQISALPQISVEAESLRKLAEGAKAALNVITSQKETLIFCSLLGAALSFIRKVLRV